MTTTVPVADTKPMPERTTTVTDYDEHGAERHARVDWVPLPIPGTETGGTVQVAWWDDCPVVADPYDGTVRLAAPAVTVGDHAYEAAQETSRGQALKPGRFRITVLD